MRQSHLFGRVCAAASLALLASTTLPTNGRAQAAGNESAAQAPKNSSSVDPAAVAALDKMGAYLRTLGSFELRTDMTTEAVLDNDQKVQFTGNAEYKVRRPNGFVITTSNTTGTDESTREFYYDGKTFTIFSPRTGFYSRASAPPTIREVLKKASEKYDIQMPLADLFRWGTESDRSDRLDSGVVVGPSKVNGQDADQYAFREGNIDWDIWIARGDKPLPVKAVLTTTSDPAKPEFTALLHWNTDAKFPEDIFAFKPPPDGKPVPIASSNP